MQKYIFQVSVELEAIDEDNAKEQMRKYCATANKFSSQHPTLNMYFSCPQIEEEERALQEDASALWRSWNMKNWN
jgi:dihydroorotate dehydrogenase